MRIRLAHAVVIALFVARFAAPAFAQPQPQPQPSDDAVALLPLDADAKLELYSQSIASEVARALAAGQIDVVVIGPKMAVPEKARLIVDGTIAGKADNITLTLRVRDARAGKVLATIPATASSVSDATEQLSKKVLPAVKAQIAALHAEETQTQVAQPPVKDEHVVPPARAVPVPVLAVVHGSSAGAPLVAPLGMALEPWAHRTVHPLANTLIDMLAPPMVAAKNEQLAIGFEVLGYSTIKGDIPSARARVRVRIVDRTHVVWDRIVRTDTVVGDKGIAPDALAARTAREVLAIVEPHVRRLVPAWR